MRKAIKKLKLNELQKESLSSKALQNVKGGACGCISACLSESEADFWDGYASGTSYCSSH